MSNPNVSRNAVSAPRIAPIAAGNAQLERGLKAAQEGLDAHFAGVSKGEDPFPGIPPHWPALGVPPRRTIEQGGALKPYADARLGADAASIVLLGAPGPNEFWTHKLAELVPRFDDGNDGRWTSNDLWVPPAAERAKLGGERMAVRERMSVRSNDDGLGLNWDGSSAHDFPPEVLKHELGAAPAAFVDAVERAVTGAGLEFLGMTFNTGSRQWRVEVRAEGYHARLAKALHG